MTWKQHSKCNLTNGKNAVFDVTRLCFKEDMKERNSIAGNDDDLAFSLGDASDVG